MAAPKGNKFWLLCSTHGRKPIFETPESLWDAACEYFSYVQANPLYETRAFQHQGEVMLKKIPRMRAMTINGLCLFLDINQETFMLYRKREGFIGVSEKILETIRSQKFEGAAADLLNGNIIARDLGLVDQRQNKNLTMFKDVSEMTDEEIQAELDDAG